MRQDYALGRWWNRRHGGPTSGFNLTQREEILPARTGIDVYGEHVRDARRNRLRISTDAAE